MCVRRPLRLTIRREDSYRAIKEEVKYAEVRLFRGCIRNIKKDDHIYLSHNGENVLIHVDRLKIFPTIENMLENDLVNMATGLVNRKKDKKFYEQFYNRKEMESYNVAVIFFRLV